MNDIFYLILFIGGAVILFSLVFVFLKLQFSAKSIENAFPDSTLTKDGKRIIQLAELDHYYVPKKKNQAVVQEQSERTHALPTSSSESTPLQKETVPVTPVMVPCVTIDEVSTASDIDDTYEISSVVVTEQDDSVMDGPAAASMEFADETTKLFKHQEIEDFYINCLSKEISGTYLDLSFLILQLFDDDFDMPSVARLEQYRESDNEYNESEYSALARVPLWKHSFNTVEEYIAGNKKTASSAGIGSSYPLSIVACLGHDLGKLTIFRTKYYVHGEHAATGADVIDQLADSKLKETQREVLSAAIRTHHYKTIKGLGNIAIKLMEADRHARKKEMLGLDLFKVQKALSHNHEETEETKYDTSEILIPWFNVREYLEELKPYINNPSLCKINYYGVSMRDGNVYFYGKLLYDAFAAVALRRGAPEAEIYKGKDDKRRLMIYLVKELKRAGAIAEDLIQEGFFCAPFVAQMANMEKGKPVLLTPFRARVFDLNVVKEDAEKEGFFTNFVSITPNYGKIAPQQ